MKLTDSQIKDRILRNPETKVTQNHAAINSAVRKTVKSDKSKSALKKIIQPCFRDTQEIFFHHSRNALQYFRSEHILSIEFGPSEIKLMYLIRADKKYRIERSEEIPFKKSARDNPEVFMHAVKDFYEECKAKNLKVVLVLGGSQVLVKMIKMPRLKKEQLKEAVYWKLKQEVPLFSDNDLWDYNISTNLVEGDSKWLSIVAVIAREDFVKKNLNLLHKNKIYPKKVIVKPVALAKALQSLTYSSVFFKKNIALIEIGRTSTLLCFYNKGVLEFAKTLASGSERIDKQLLNPVTIGKKIIQIKPQKMELFKRKYGIVGDLLKQQGGMVTPYKQLHKRMLPALKNYVYEIQRAIVFYENSYSRKEIDLAVVTGDGSYLKNLSTFLNKQLGITVYPLALFQKSKQDVMQFDGREYTACFGAASHIGKKFNLIPRNIRKSKKYRYWQKIITYSSFLFFSCLFLVSNNTSSLLDNHKTVLAAEKIKYEQVVSLERKYNEHVEQKNNLEKFSTVLLNELQNSSDVQDNLRIISALIPENILLTRLEFKEKGSSKLYNANTQAEDILFIDGMIYNKNNAEDILLLQFISSLQDLGYYKEIELTEKSKNESKQTFNFKMKLVTP